MTHGETHTEPPHNAETTQSPGSSRDSLRAGLLMGLAGFSALSVGDGIVKSMGGEWPGTAVAALRYSIGAIGLGLLVLIVEGKSAFHLPKPKMQALRGLSVGLASVAFFCSIFLMPLATATSIQFISPMMTALISAMFLGERIGRVTMFASIIAFAGVMVVLRPGVGDLGWATILPVLAALGMALLMIGNRAVSHSGSVLLMQFWVAAFASPILLVIAFVGHASDVSDLHIVWPHWTVLARCTLVAVTATGSHLLVYMATMRASAAKVAPTVYIQLLVAIVIGMAFYGDQPDALSLVGATMIVGAGLWLWNSTRAPIVDDA